MHQRLKHFSVAHFMFVRMVTVTGLGGMLTMNLCRNYPGSSNKQARPLESVLELPKKLTNPEIWPNIELVAGPLGLWDWLKKWFY